MSPDQTALTARTDLKQPPLAVNLYLGGSFDPVHNGHLALLKHVYHSLITCPPSWPLFSYLSHSHSIYSYIFPSIYDWRPHLKPLLQNSLHLSSHVAVDGQVNAYFLPTSRSPLKQNCSDPAHRLQMLKLATEVLQADSGLFTDCQSSASSSSLSARLSSTHLSSISHSPLSIPSSPSLSSTSIESPSTSVSPFVYSSVSPQPSTSPFTVSEYEIWQTPPTYTIDTLTALREENPTDSMIFIVGADNIASLPKWREGDKLTQFAHLWVIPRHNLQTKADIVALLPDRLKEQVTSSIADLKSHCKGLIYIDSQPVPALSSSDIRQAIAQGNFNIAKTALPHPVYSYIMKNNLYQNP